MSDTPISQGQFVLHNIMAPCTVGGVNELGNNPVKVHARMSVARPIENLNLRPQEDGDVETAWELLAGSTTNLAELAELAYGAYTPSTAWETWRHVADGLHFRGTPEDLEVRTAEAVERERQARAAKAAEKDAWESFIARLREGQTQPADERYLKEFDDRANGQRPDRRLFRVLGSADRPETAHALLRILKRWDPTVNLSQRLGCRKQPGQLLSSSRMSPGAI